MIIRDGEYKINAIPQMKGGIGQFVTEEMVPPEYLGKAGTLLSGELSRPETALACIRMCQIWRYAFS